jgi:hypothetical protein
MCLASIMALSTISFAAAIYALRSGAPMSPAVMGAVGGLLAGGLWATVFATQRTIPTFQTC